MQDIPTVSLSLSIRVLYLASHNEFFCRKTLLHITLYLVYTGTCFLFKEGIYWPQYQKTHLILPFSISIQINSKVGKKYKDTTLPGRNSSRSSFEKDRPFRPRWLPYPSTDTQRILSYLQLFQPVATARRRCLKIWSKRNPTSPGAWIPKLRSFCPTCSRDKP